MYKPNQHIDPFIGSQTVTHNTQQVNVQTAQQNAQQNIKYIYIYISHYNF